MTTGEGGIVVTDDADFARVVRSLGNQGRDDDGTWMNHVRLGYNYRLDEMSAALGPVAARPARRDPRPPRPGRRAGTTSGSPRSTAGPVPVVAAETTRMSWFVYVVRLDERVDRAALIADLEADGVPTRPYFVPDPPPAALPRAVRLPAGRLPRDRAGRADHPGPALLHRHDRGAGRHLVRMRIAVRLSLGWARVSRSPKGLLDCPGRGSTSAFRERGARDSLSRAGGRPEVGVDACVTENHQMRIALGEGERGETLAVGLRLVDVPDSLGGRFLKGAFWSLVGAAASRG